MAIEADFTDLISSFERGIMPGAPDASQKINDGAAANASSSLFSGSHSNAGVVVLCVEGELFVMVGSNATSAPSFANPHYTTVGSRPLLIRKKSGQTLWYRGATSTANRVRGGTAAFFQES